MSTTGQFSSKNPTIKRILKEASELATQPSADYHAAPLENDLLEWHFTLRGPPAPSPFAGGVYHGRIVLPPAYPLKPPSFRFLTPTGRFEVNREICLSISGHHEETWQPAWGIRTALVAIRSFMDTDAKGQLGGMDASAEMRKRLASQSRTSKCATCGKTTEQIMLDQDEAVTDAGGESQKEQIVPEELRLAYREDLSEEKNAEKVESVNDEAATSTPAPVPTRTTRVNTLQAAVAQPLQPAPAAAHVAPQQQQQQQLHQPAPRRNDELPPWIDKAIYGILAALVFMIWKRYLL